MTLAIPLQLKILFVSILISSCNPSQSQDSKPPNIFTGKYEGAVENTTATLRLWAEKEMVSGIFALENQTFTVNATSNAHTFAGEIVDDKSGSFHKIAGQIKGGTLFMQITFPEYNYQVVEIVLKPANDLIQVAQIQKSAQDKLTYQPENLPGDPALVGKWRFTEVLSSGSGEFYASFATDYFLRINSDGTAVSWIGQSAGGGDSMTIEGDYGSDIYEFGWYTKGDQFFMIDPNDKDAKQSVRYFAEPSRMMMSIGDNKRLYERVE